jgi:hypothetical protein
VRDGRQQVQHSSYFGLVLFPGAVPNKQNCLWTCHLPLIVRRPLRSPQHTRCAGRWLRGKEDALRQKHVVTAGETKWSIANMHGVGEPALALANAGGPSLNNLCEGQVIWLPENCVASASVPPKPSLALLLPMNCPCR